MSDNTQGKATTEPTFEQFLNWLRQSTGRPPVPGDGRGTKNGLETRGGRMSKSDIAVSICVAVAVLGFGVSGFAQVMACLARSEERKALEMRVTELERCNWQAAPVPPAQVMPKGGE